MSRATARSGRMRHRVGMRLDRFLTDMWLPAIRATVRPSTYYNYCSHVRRHIEPHIGELALTDIDGPALNRLYAVLLATGRTKGGPGGLSPATVARVHVTLHRALNDAVRWGHLAENPAGRCDPPKIGRHGVGDMTTWDTSELRRFFEFVEDDELRALWHLLAMTGLRRGEALALRWTDVDLEAASLAVRRTVIAVGAEVILSRPKTARGTRVVALDQHTVAVLRAHHGGDDLLFCSAAGDFLHPISVSRRFDRLVKMSGLPRIRLHDLRHSHATICLRAGIHPKIVSERLGHATVSLTLDVYSHAIPSMQTEAASRLAREVFGGGSMP